MTPEEWLKDQKLLVAEPVWSNYMDTDMNLYYYLIVTDPEKAKRHLQMRGFNFKNGWKWRVPDFVMDNAYAEIYLQKMGFDFDDPNWTDHITKFVEDSSKAKKILEEAGFNFADKWENRILDWISNDITDIQSPGRYSLPDTGWEIRYIDPDKLEK